MRTGAILENVFTEQDSVETGEFATRNMQFLYPDHEGFHFMDTETYEQVMFSKEAIGDTKYFLREGEVYAILLLGPEPLNVDLPSAVVMVIAETEPGVRGDSVSNITKLATTETGLQLKVPLFVNERDKIKVDTRSMEYLSKA
jgi:elongation factor P